MDTIEIPLNKNRLFVGFIAAVAFVATGFWLLIERPLVKFPWINSQVLVIATGIVAVLFFGAGAIFLISKLLNIKPGLLINSKGLTDNSSGLAAKLIDWSDIEKFNEIGVFGQKLIVILVKNPHHYIERQNNVIVKKGMEFNHKKYGSPIIINVKSLKIKQSDLISILKGKKQLFEIKAQEQNQSATFEQT